jgi:hypothetical protein
MDKRVTKSQDIRRRHSDALKRELVERSLEPGASVAAIAQGAGANANVTSAGQYQWSFVRPCRTLGSCVDAHPSDPNDRLAAAGHRGSRLRGGAAQADGRQAQAAAAAHHNTAGQRCGCTACGGRLRQIGQDVSGQLEYVPSHFKVIRHVRPKLASLACQTIFQAAAPSRPSRAASPGPG